MDVLGLLTKRVAEHGGIPLKLGIRRRRGGTGRGQERTARAVPSAGGYNMSQSEVRNVRDHCIAFYCTVNDDCDVSS